MPTCKEEQAHILQR